MTNKNDLELLPSLNTRLQLNDDLFLRFAVSRTVTRPQLAQLDPGLSLSASTATLLGSGTSGNPHLGPEKSDNVDLSLEDYFGHQNSLSGALFYRRVNGYIQSAIAPETIAGITYQVTLPSNAPAGHIDGATFDAKNLLNSYYQDYFGTPYDYPRDTRRFDQTYSVGFRYRL